MPRLPINNEQRIATNPIARRISVLPRLLACQSAREELDDEFAKLDSYRDTINMDQSQSNPLSPSGPRGPSSSQRSLGARRPHHAARCARGHRLHASATTTLEW